MDGKLSEKPVGSIWEAVYFLDEAYGKEGWHQDFGFMSPAYHWAQITVAAESALMPLVRKAVSERGPDAAFLNAYRMLGGVLNLDLLAPRKPYEAPKPSGTPSAQPIKAALPSIHHNGPVPYKDSHTHIPPVYFPQPPNEPDWFGKGIGSWATWKDTGKGRCPWMKETTWHDAVHAEVETPGGRDQPLGYIMKIIGRNPKTFEGKDAAGLKRAYNDFIGKAKAASIWAMLARDQRREEAEANQDSPDPGASTLVPGEEVPW